MMSVWADFMTKRGIHAADGRRRTIVLALIDLLYREDHIAAKHLHVKTVVSRGESDEEFKFSQETPQKTDNDCRLSTGSFPNTSQQRPKIPR